jgi:hypothetical protein
MDIYRVLKEEVEPTRSLNFLYVIGSVYGVKHITNAQGGQFLGSQAKKVRQAKDRPVPGGMTVPSLCLQGLLKDVLGDVRCLSRLHEGMILGQPVPENSLCVEM